MCTAAQPNKVLFMNGQFSLWGTVGQLQRIKAALAQQLGCTDQLPCL